MRPAPTDARKIPLGINIHLQTSRVSVSLRPPSLNSCTPRAQAAVDRGLLRSGKRTQYDPADMAKVLDIAGQVAAGVQHLHARGIVHGGAHSDTPLLHSPLSPGEHHVFYTAWAGVHGGIAILRRPAALEGTSQCSLAEAASAVTLDTS